MRLIDADALERRMYVIPYYDNRDEDAVIDEIYKSPTIDAVPVVRGEWQWCEEWKESTPDGSAECQSAGYACSVCGIELSEYLSESLGEMVFADNYAEVPKIAFCPNCGADMRESEVKQ